MSSPTSRVSDSKVALITGASSGFGKETAKLLSTQGITVFGTSRNPSNAQDPNGFRMLKLDVTSDESVSLCIQELLQRTNGRIDILVNNAGFALFGAIEEATIEEAKMQLETNLFGVMRMVHAVLPTMRLQKSGQIINVGSLAGYIAVPFQGYYATAKFALEGYTEALRYETKRLGIKVSIVEPGFFKTNIGQAAKVVNARIEDYKQPKKNAISTLKHYEEEGQDPKIVAETILQIIQSNSPNLHYPVGKEKSALIYKRLLPQSIFESGARRRWKLDA